MTQLLQHIAFPEPALERAKEGGAASHDRFADLVERQSQFVFRVAYSVLRNIEDAEDVVQETFLKLHRSGRWEGVENERGFLARVAWRIAVERLPKTRGEPTVAEGLSNDNPERAVIASDQHAAIHRMIDSLPGELRQPLTLSAIEEMNSQQIAHVMGIPEGTVRWRLSRARQVLKQKLSGLLAGPQ